MANATQAEISADTGEIYDAVDGGTTAVAAMIIRAQRKVKNITGTTSGAGRDDAIRALSDAFVCNQVLGGVDPISKNISGIAVGEKKLQEMRDEFKEEFEEAIDLMGFNITGNAIKWVSVNQ